MKAIVCRSHGSIDALQLEEVAEPQPGSDELLVEVHACGANFLDTLMIQNRYPATPPLPFIPGIEIAGVVRDCGKLVTGFAAGDRVVALAPAGGYAEKAVVPGWRARRIADSMEFRTAASMFVAFGTAQHALTQRAALKSGETLLVLGAAGGSGAAAVQVGKAIGARVIAAAGSESKLDVALRHGADAVINYGSDDLCAAVLSLTDGAGVDVAFDPVGGDLAESCLHCMAWNGRYLVVGFAAGRVPALPANVLLGRGIAATGVFWGAFRERERPADCTNHDVLQGWYRQGLIKPQLWRTYPLAHATNALHDLAERRAEGKIVLDIRECP